MTPFWTPPWLGQRAGTSYPFADGSPLASRGGDISLAGAVLDAILYPAGGDGTLAVTGVVVASGTVTVRVGTAAAPTLASGSFPALDPPAGLALADGDGLSAGLLSLDRAATLAATATWIDGEYPFDSGSATFAAMVQLPVPDGGLRGLLVAGRVLDGDVWIVGGDGVVVRLDPAAGVGVSAIRFDVVGDPLAIRRDCADDSGIYTPTQFVTTINGIEPDRYGRFRLVVDDRLVTDTLLRITPRDGTIVVEVAGP